MATINEDSTVTVQMSKEAERVSGIKSFTFLPLAAFSNESMGAKETKPEDFYIIPAAAE